MRILAICLALATVSIAMQKLPEGEGKKLLEERCASCHDMQPVTSLRQNAGAWKELILKMRAYGARLNDTEVDVVTEYLTKHFGTASSAAATKPDTPEEKTAKRLIDGICSSCHDGGLVRS